ncbi:MAG: DUF748 domain-containing protein [Gammaproteobacteria bacterium]
MTTRARHWLIVLGTVVLLTLAYAAAGFLGVPHVLRSQILSFVSDHYGRTASIGEIRFNPFTFALEARDFSLPDADGQPMLAFGRLWLDLDAATLWRLAPSFSDIEIERPFIRTLVRKDGALNLADLAKPFETVPPPRPPPPDSKPARLFVDRFNVSGGKATYEDASRPSPFKAQIDPITFELRDFSTTGKTGNTYSLSGASSSGEKFAWNGSFGVAPLASQGRFEVTDLQAHTIWSYLRDSLGFELSSGKINFNGDYHFAATPALALTVDVHTVSVADLGIRPTGQHADYIQHTNVQVENTRLDLAGERVDVGKIHLTSGTVRAWRDAKGAINLLELMAADKPATTAAAATVASPAASAAPPAASAAATVAPPATASATPPAAASAADTPATDAPSAPRVTTSKSAAPSRWVFAAPDIAVENLRLELEDRLVKPSAAFTLAPVNLNVRGYGTTPGSKLDVDANIGINESGKLQARANVAPDSGAITAHVDLDGLDLEAIQPYVNTYTQITLLSGVLKSGLDIERSTSGALDIKGDTEVLKLRTVDNALRQDLVRWDQLKLEGLRYRSDPQSLSIATLSARAPYARVIIAPDQSLNIVKAASPASGTSAPAVQTVQAPSGERRAPAGNPGGMKVSIGTVRIANGSANFADFWIQPNYAVSLQGLNGTIVGLSSDPASRAKVALEGKVDRYAPARIGGEVNLLSAALFTDMKVSFQGVELTSVTPYSGRFAGYKIEKGKLSIDVTYRVANRKLDAKQHFVVDQLQLGERVESPDAVHLPLRLAVALLKDRNGVIDLDLPITGSLDDPQFRIGPIIWKVVVNLITKVATAPFALLGSLFGGGEEMNLIDFQPGATALDTAAQERITSLAKALKERPQLQLDVPASYSPDADGSVLAARKLNGKLQALADKQAAAAKKGASSGTLETILADPSRRFDLLLAQYRLDYGADTAPPASAAAVLATPKKKVEAAAFTTASDELERAITTKEPVTEREFDELAQARARAIQDALLGPGEIDPARVFLLGASAAKPTDGKVRIALSLK